MINRIKNSKIILIFCLHFITVFISTIYGKLNAHFIKPEEQGLYALQFGVMTFLHSFLIGPIINNFKANYNITSNPIFLTKSFSIVLLVIYGISLIISISFSFSFLDPTFIIIWFTFAFQGLYTFSDEILLLNFHYTKNSLMKIVYNVLLVLLFALIVIYFGEKGNQGLWLVLGLATLFNFGVSAYQTHKLFTGKNNQIYQLSQPFNWIINTVSFWQYALPLMGLSIFAWISNYIDRYIINYYLNQESVGIYAVTYGLGARMLLLSTPFITYLSPILLNNAGQQFHVGISHQKIFHYLRYYILITACACVVLYILKDWVGFLFLSQYYQPGFYLIPIVGLAYAFLGVIHILETKFYAYNQTKYILYHNIVGAVANLLLNLYCIPIWGLGGAAFSTLLSIGIQLVFIIYLFKE